MRVLLTTIALLAVLAPASFAASRNEIIRDCSDDGRLDGNYTAAELRDARKNLPADVDEYTDCRDVLRRAELAASGASASGGTGSGGFGGVVPGGPGGTGGAPLTPGTPEEAAALEAARNDPGAPVAVGGEKVVPGASGLASYAARHELPWPLIAALVLLGLAAIGASVPAIRRRVLNRRAHPA